MKFVSFRSILYTLYAVSLTFVLVAAFVGMPYYTTPLADRPHMAMHQYLKPGGLWGHGLGIIGSSMILLLFLYSLRKRNKLGLRFGHLSRWLDIHIYFGIIGPLLITLHTAMKFHGVVSISYFSMLIVALSGVFGRYIYMQIPRDQRGSAMNLRQIRERAEKLRESLRGEVPESVFSGVDVFSAQPVPIETAGPGAIAMTMWMDITLPWRIRKVRRVIRQGNRQVPERRLRAAVKLVHQQTVLARRMATIETMTRALHYWHLFHKPFAYIMVAIMFVHIAVAVSFGYTWVF